MTSRVRASPCARCCPPKSRFFQHRILFRALEDLGYTIAQPNEAEYQTIHVAIGAGDADFTAVSWETLHKGFFDEAGGTKVMSRVGNYIAGALQGYLIDKATYDSGVHDLSQLKDPVIAKKFDSDGDGKADLAGCIPGWGCERVIEHELDEYKLRDTVTHNQGSYQAMMADTIARFKTGKPVLYYTWTPYWVSGVLVPGKDVEWLSVPYTSLPDGAKLNTEFNGKNLGFAVDNIGVVARNDFLVKNPAAKKLFEVAKLDINDISAENKLITDGQKTSADIDRHVANWIKANQATYDSWLKSARDAAK
ncbi:glycine betaine/L-proline ABC transporter substrate-binding protein ProX [Neorhizobium galegae]|uniref:glycine betaine/L-proline ABC transporter substrate-binding protein ProX n=1 Tax=Neorhizobium galegae TaxID=399 RepID=UPI0021071639|nr:glycine betaine/L-proline ABC transporter substrate-binding protein ProX [Neorhizobium galegae]MCQ1854566.1 glycine betaine/L-proline ABC transporter substrate-binding protein ProX [Neorhizobium galegae]